MLSVVSPGSTTSATDVPANLDNGLRQLYGEEQQGQTTAALKASRLVGVAREAVRDAQRRVLNLGEVDAMIADSPKPEFVRACKSFREQFQKVDEVLEFYLTDGCRSISLLYRRKFSARRYLSAIQKLAPLCSNFATKASMFNDVAYLSR